MKDIIGNRAFDRKQGCEEALRKTTFQLKLASQSQFFSKCSNNTDHVPALGKYG